MSEKILAWHFLREDRKLRFEPFTLVEAGQKLTYGGPLVLCQSGLHASEKPLHALEYAPGPIVCRVELSGEIVRGDDKICSAERKCLWIADGTRTLHEFACWCTEEVLHSERKAGREPNPLLWKCVDAKRLWMEGKMTNEELDTAHASARGAACAYAAGAYAAAHAAAYAAACAYAAHAAAAHAAHAAGLAAYAAAHAAQAAAHAAQNQKLEEMLLSLEPKE